MVDMEVILLGHSDLKLTLKYYQYIFVRESMKFYSNQKV